MPIARFVLVWALLAVLMIINGIIREIVLVRMAGRRAADVLSAVLGIAIILGTTRPFLRPLAGHAALAQLITIGAMWLVMTVAFEFLFGHYVDRKSWSMLAGNYAIWRGNLWPLVLASLIAAPFVWAHD